MAVSREAEAAARIYLRGLGYTERSYGRDKRAWKEALRETAEIIQSLGLCGNYINRESRFARKRRAYREAEERRGQPHPRYAAQSHRSGG